MKAENKDNEAREDAEVQLTESEERQNLIDSITEWQITFEHHGIARVCKTGYYWWALFPKGEFNLPDEDEEGDEDEIDETDTVYFTDELFRSELGRLLPFYEIVAIEEFYYCHHFVSFQWVVDAIERFYSHSHNNKSTPLVYKKIEPSTFFKDKLAVQPLPDDLLVPHETCKSFRIDDLDEYSRQVVINTIRRSRNFTRGLMEALEKSGLLEDPEDSESD